MQELCGFRRIKNLATRKQKKVQKIKALKTRFYKNNKKCKKKFFTLMGRIADIAE